MRGRWVLPSSPSMRVHCKVPVVRYQELLSKMSRLLLGANLVPFRLTRRVEFADTDMAGIVHFSNFFRFMEAAEHAYLRACGLSGFCEWEGQTITFPRVHASCDFVKPIRFQEEVTIAVTVERIGRTSAQYAFVFFKGD